MSQAIDNTNLINYRPIGIDGFIPVATYVFDPVAKTVTVQDGTTLPSGDTLKIVHLKVHDKLGNDVHGEITVTGAGGKQTIDVSTLDISRGLNITATVLTTQMRAADGSAVNIQAAGSLGYWDAQQNA